MHTHCTSAYVGLVTITRKTSTCCISPLWNWFYDINNCPVLRGQKKIAVVDLMKLLRILHVLCERLPSASIIQAKKVCHVIFVFLLWISCFYESNRAVGLFLDESCKNWLDSFWIRPNSVLILWQRPTPSSYWNIVQLDFQTPQFLSKYWWTLLVTTNWFERSHEKS